MSRVWVLCSFLSVLAFSLASDPSALQGAKGKEVSRHESGFAFPKEIGQFRLANVRKFDPAGHDTSYSYHNVALRALVTIYIHPKSETAPRNGIRDHFADLLADLSKHHPGAKGMVSEAVSVRFRGCKQSGMRVIYAEKRYFAGRSEDLHSELYLFAFKDYFVKFRITYAKGNAKKCQEAVSKLMESIAWPK